MDCAVAVLIFSAGSIFGVVLLACIFGWLDRRMR